jgi:glycosyltransferase involved in cell wall biosynthesis
LLLTKTDFLRPRDGGSLRVAAIARRLSEDADFRLHAVPVEGEAGAGIDARSVRIMTRLVANLRVIASFIRIGSLSSARWYRPRVVGHILALQSRFTFDVTLIEYSQLLGYRPLFKGPVALDMHNIESELMANYAKSSESRAKRVLARHETVRLRSVEARAFSMTDLVAVVSEHDAATLTRISRGRGIPAAPVVAPNGVADEAFEANETGQGTVVFVAHLGWAPNIDAAEWLCTQVWPRVLAAMPTARLQLVGRSPAKRVKRLQSPGIELHADVESVIPFVAAASVATAPLQAAGGTRLKILEALACGTPVVSTPLGALGLDHIPPPALTVSDGAKEFADAVLRLLAGRPDRYVVRSAAEPFRWQRALSELVQGVDKIADGGVRDE